MFIKRFSVKPPTMTWAQYKKEQKDRRRRRIYGRTIKLIQLTQEGYRVEKKADYQYRINGIIDILPVHNGYHDLIRNEHGGFRELKSFVRSYMENNETRCGVRI